MRGPVYPMDLDMPSRDLRPVRARHAGVVDASVPVLRAIDRIGRVEHYRNGGARNCVGPHHWRYEIPRPNKSPVICEGCMGMGRVTAREPVIIDIVATEGKSKTSRG